MQQRADAQIVEGYFQLKARRADGQGSERARQRLQ